MNLNKQQVLLVSGLAMHILSEYRDSMSLPQMLRTMQIATRLTEVNMESRIDTFVAGGTDTVEVVLDLLTATINEAEKWDLPTPAPDTVQ